MQGKDFMKLTNLSKLILKTSKKKKGVSQMSEPNLESSQADATKKNEYPDYYYQERFVCDCCEVEFEEDELRRYKKQTICNNCFDSLTSQTGE
jgi:hypothetical protein